MIFHHYVQIQWCCNISEPAERINGSFFLCVAVTTAMQIYAHCFTTEEMCGIEPLAMIAYSGQTLFFVEPCKVAFVIHHDQVIHHAEVIASLQHFSEVLLVFTRLFEILLLSPKKTVHIFYRIYAELIFCY